MTSALETKDLGLRYGRRWGLRDCTLSVEPGTITGLVGPNGAGKSTLLRLASGLARPTTGSATIFGARVRPNGTAHLAQLGYLDQLRPLYRGFRVTEMLGVGRRLSPRWDDELARTWLSELDIDFAARVDDLSVGQRAEVALALCLGKRPDLLLLDEPVADLDPLARHRLLRSLLGCVAEHGTTVVITSHILSELEPVCDHLLILSASRLLLDGGVDALLAEHRIVTGPRTLPRPPDVAVIMHSATERQQTLLVRGPPDQAVPGWDMTTPTLEEIVLAYLAREQQAGTGGHGTGEAP